MRLLGALVVGIGSYRLDSHAFPALKFAAADAAQVTDYLRACWPSDAEATIVHLAEADAGITAIREAFATLKQAAPFDLLFVFLSGHGIVSESHGQSGFVLQPEAGDSQTNLLVGAELDRCLATVGAVRTVLILDCCYAEAVVNDMAYFRELGASDARIFVASSRRTQLTWEDDDLGHGIFTAHLLDLLRTGDAAPLSSVHKSLSVDGELFPILCEQVPLYVLSHKNQRQEPVKGGMSIRGVSLPVEAAARRIREQSAFSTAMRHARRILLTGAVGVAACLALAYNFVYYAEADTDGQIRLRHGTRWLAPAYRFFPTTMLDTGMEISELSAKSEESYLVRAGQAAGIWTHLTRQGYRGWYDVVRGSLDSEAARRYDVLLGTPADFDFLDETSNVTDVERIAWKQLDTYVPADLDNAVDAVPRPARQRGALKRFDPAEQQFEVLDLSGNQLADYLSALKYAAAVNPDRAFEGYVGFLQECTMWLAHSSPEQHGSDVQRGVAEGVADVFATIVKARADRGLVPVSPEMQATLDKLKDSGYHYLVDLSLNRADLLSAKTPERMQAALGQFHGDSEKRDEDAALQTIVGGLDGSDSAKAVADEVCKRFVSVGGLEQTDLTAFLMRAAGRRSLSPALIDMLLGKARAAIEHPDKDDWMQSEYARILAHAMSQVPPDSRPVVFRLIDTVFAHRPPQSSALAEIHTSLVRQGLETPKMLSDISERAAKAPPPNKGGSLVPEPMPGLMIVVGWGPWLQSLAEVGTLRQLDPSAVRTLEAHGDDPAVKQTVWRALARQASWAHPDCQNGRCGQFLVRFTSDGVGRRLAVRVLAEQLALLPRAEFDRALLSLARERERETEPEVRISIGQVRVFAQLARIRTPELGKRFFE